jgi:hypothetical protein
MVEKTTLYLHEIFELIDKASAKKEKVELLKKHDSIALKNILKGTFDDAIEWNLPDGVPPYTPSESHNAPTNLLKRYDQFKYFVKKGPGANLNQIKREMMFIRLIESIHPKDAELVLNMVAKKSPAKGLTKALVKEVFPSLISK